VTRSPTVERGLHALGPGIYSITAEPPPQGKLARLMHRARRTLTAGSRAVDRIEAIYVTDDGSAGERLREHWDDLRTEVPMVILDSPYRGTAGALLKYLAMVQKREPPHTLITVLIPEIQPSRWWHPLVHNYLARRLKWLLLFRRGTAVTSVPYAVRD